MQLLKTIIIGLLIILAASCMEYEEYEYTTKCNCKKNSVYSQTLEEADEWMYETLIPKVASASRALVEESKSTDKLWDYYHKFTHEWTHARVLAELHEHDVYWTFMAGYYYKMLASYFEEET